MGWATLVLRRRAATQRMILVTVLAVAITGSGLLGTFALLLGSSQNRALDSWLSRQPASATEVEADLSIGLRDPVVAVDAAAAALDEILGPVASTRADWLSSVPYTLPVTPENPRVPLALLGAYPEVAAHAELVAGTWTTTDASADRVEVVVPQAAVDRFGWEVGAEVALASTSRNVTLTAVVVGVYEASAERTYWERDTLQGAGHDDRFVVPGTFGAKLTDAYGPLITTSATMLGSAVETSDARIVLSPDMTTTAAGELGAMRERLDSGPTTLLSATSGNVLSAVLLTRLPSTIDGAASQLAVTQVVLVVLGLMLAVLAVTVLQLAARLLTERRTAEQTLLTSRGASGRQLLRLGVLEALAVAAVTTLAAPWLGWGVHHLISAREEFVLAGLDADPGRPAALWVTCGVAALVFAVVLVSPLLTRGGSVVDTEQQRVRQDRRGAMTRSGLDVLLVGLALVAYLQLRQYRSPVLRSGGLDPVLVAGPALFLLAGAAVALRVVPLVTALAERRARRSRSLAMPLAAWEVSRRPRRASGAVLLLTLAVAVGVFAQSFLATWHRSQTDQATVLVGTDLQVQRLGTEPLVQSSAIGAFSGVEAVSAVTSRTVQLGQKVELNGLTTSTPAELLAVDTTQAGALLPGTLPDGRSWGDVLGALAPTTPVTGIELPTTTRALTLDVTASTEADADLQLLVEVLVQDAHGVRAALEADALVSFDGAPRTVEVTLAPRGIEDADPLVEPVAVLGLIGRVLGDDAPTLTDEFSYVVQTQALTAVGAEDARTPLDLGRAEWDGRSLPSYFGEVGALTSRTSSDRRTLTVIDDGGRAGTVTPGFVLSTVPSAPPVPIVVSDELASAIDATTGDRFYAMVDNLAVKMEVVGRVPYLPSVPHGKAFVADRDALGRVLLLAGHTDPVLDSWWLAVPDARAAEIAQDVRERLGGTTTDLAALETEMIDGPLRIGIQSALWVTVLAALALAVAGFTMSATVSVRLRRLEFARLQALGARRSGLVRSVVAEHALLAVLGFVSGSLLGTFLTRLISPRVTVAPDGSPPVPDVQLVWAWPNQTALLVTLGVLLALAVTLTTTVLLRRASAELLRLGDDR
ncbi:FtsX-like permease family protein [Cellulomonas sp. P22]|uniref:FtsX-like permease family protein n=1 Tax=Cellulomonas sp. P22 TaxID=3373189 RepID=UPI0037972052